MEVKTVPQIFELKGGYSELHEELIYGY
jgi:hypothetical protein